MNTTEAAPSAIRPPIWEDEFCTAFRITQRTARRWRVQRRGPKWFYVGKRVAYNPKSIESWCSELEEQGATSR